MGPNNNFLGDVARAYPELAISGFRPERCLRYGMHATSDRQEKCSRKLVVMVWAEGWPASGGDATPDTMRPHSLHPGRCRSRLVIQGFGGDGTQEIFSNHLRSSDGPDRWKSIGKLLLIRTEAFTLPRGNTPSDRPCGGSAPAGKSSRPPRCKQSRRLVSCDGRRCNGAFQFFRFFPKLTTGFHSLGSPFGRHATG